MLTSSHNRTYAGDENAGGMEDFIVFSKNARINSPECLNRLLAELKDVPWDAILFSETRTGSNKQVLDGGHVLFTHLDTNMYAGVGILLHSKHVKKSNRVRIMSDRVLALDVCVNAVRITVVAVYMPHFGYSLECFANTYEQLRCVL